ncbi:hypothetical protein [Microvirga pudoricolor]|uniref:hypothetical protein n=1 Tax=Microvirga pudoricolor TaxID=2778729 RepID=UPI00194FB150|nr:hypothetical protein [Microvirga pudoricolor]MBM6594204.1 hypothetical protein [Microvirga pudoricolor]
MTSDIHQGPLEAATEVAAPARRSWREQRELRRRRRVWLEELMGWILVPIIIVGTYWLVVGGLDALGTSPSAIINGLSTITSAF